MAVAAALVVVVSGDGDGSVLAPWDATGDVSDGPGPGGGVEGWTAAADDSPDRGEVIRVLTLGDDLVIVTDRSLTAIDRLSGELRWQTHLEQLDAAGRVAVACGAGGGTSGDGTLVVSVGYDDLQVEIDGRTVYGGDCTGVAPVDLRTGELGPVSELAYDDDGVLNPEMERMPVEVVDDTVVVSWFSTLFGLGAADLAESWRWTVEGHPGREQMGFCEITEVVPGEPERVVAVSRCVRDDAELSEPDSWFVDELTLTGEPVRSHTVTAEEAEMEAFHDLQLVSASPLVLDVVLAPSGDVPDGDRSLVAFDQSWDGATVIGGERTNDRSDEALTTHVVGHAGRHASIRGPSRSRVAGETLVSFTAPWGEQNELVAVDLATGDVLWTASPPSGQAVWQVLSADGETVVAVAQEEGGPGQSLVLVDQASGEIREERTVEVARPDGQQLGPSDPARIGYVPADDRAYAVDFDNRPGEAADSWLAFTVG